jgi:hypothetical protein
MPRPIFGRSTRAALPAALIAAACIVPLVPQHAAATPAFTQQTKQPCGRCHTNAASGALNPFGQKFKENGHKLPAK